MAVDVVRASRLVVTGMGLMLSFVPSALAGRPPEATGAQQPATSSSATAADQPDGAQLVERARLLAAAGQRAAALALLTDVVTTADAVGDRTVAARARLERGRVLYGDGQREEAVRVWADARAAFEALGDVVGELDTLNAMGHVRQHVQDRPLYERAFKLAEQSGDPLQQARVRARWSAALLNDSQWAAALAELDVAERLLRPLGRSTRPLRPSSEPSVSRVPATTRMAKCRR